MGVPIHRSVPVFVMPKMVSSLWRMVLIVGLILAGGGVCEAAKKKGKGGKKSGSNPAALIKSLEAHLANLRAVYADASTRLAAAQANLSKAGTIVEGVKSALHGARSSEHNAELALKQASQELERDAPEEYKNLRNDYEKAKEQMKAEQERVLNSPEFLKANAAAKELGGVEATMVARNQALKEDSQFQTALSEYKRLGNLFNSKRMELLKQNPRWSQEAETAAKAGIDVKEQENRLQSSMMTMYSAYNAVKKSSGLASAAQQAIAADEAKLAQLKKSNAGKKKK